MGDFFLAGEDRALDLRGEAAAFLAGDARLRRPEPPDNPLYGALLAALLAPLPAPLYGPLYRPLLAPMYGTLLAPLYGTLLALLYGTLLAPLYGPFIPYVPAGGGDWSHPAVAKTVSLFPVSGRDAEQLPPLPQSGPPPLLFPLFPAFPAFLALPGDLAGDLRDLGELGLRHTSFPPAADRQRTRSSPAAVTYTMRPPASLRPVLTGLAASAAISLWYRTEV